MKKLLTLMIGLTALAAAAQDLKPGVVGEYFNKEFKDGNFPADAKPFYVKVDKTVNFRDAAQEFNGSKLSDKFMVRWRGVLTADKAGSYGFSTTSDDGSRLYIDGKMVVDNWGLHGMEEKTGSVDLTAGKHEFEVLFWESGGGAGCIVQWTPPGGKKSPIPAKNLGHRPDQLVAYNEARWKKVKKPKKAKGGGGVVYDAKKHGPFQGTAVGLGSAAATNNWQVSQTENTAYRGIIIPLSENAQAGVVFDTDTMRMAAGWTDGGLVLTGLPYTGGHGPYPGHVGDRLWTMKAAPGWGKGSSIAEPREGAYPPLGPLPKDWSRFSGLYKHGDKVVLSYTVGSAKVLEMAGLENGAVTRTFQIEGNSGMTIVLADAPDGSTGGKTGVLKGESTTTVSAVGAPAGSAFAVRDGLLVFDIKASGKTNFKLAFAGGDAAATPAAAESLKPFTKPGPRQWTETATTKGEIGSGDGPYVLDRVTVPFSNPWGTQMRIGGMDFFSDGTTAAVSTWNGDVFIVKGIDEKMENLEWSRFACGGHETLGLKIVDDVIYTVSDSQITRYHDTNNDGEADYYENFNNDWDLTSGFHAFCFDLHTDKEGNFYFAFGAPVRNGGRSFMRIGRHHGSVIRVSKDGSKMERYAHGFRAPNGMGVGPDGQVTTGDNEGTFVPRSPINWVKYKSFNGVIDTAENRENFKTTSTMPEHNGDRPKHLDVSEAPKPLAWLPKGVDNSGGGQVWVTSDKWGPFTGELLHMSYGQSSLYLVMKEEKNGQIQGGVTKFPLKFTSSAMRARFNERDGQLYVAGLKGWQSNAAKEGGFDRVRYTGKTPAMPSALKATPTGVEITFTTKLDAELANDPGSYAVKASDIAWKHDYGSQEYNIGNRESGKFVKGWTTMTVSGAKLQADGKTVALTIDNMQPVHQMQIDLDLETADGDEIITKIWNTVHETK